MTGRWWPLTRGVPALLQERELSDRTYDWKEEIYRKIKGMEDALSEQKAYWEAQLGPIRDQVTQLKDLLQGHRIDLAKVRPAPVEGPLKLPPPPIVPAPP